MSGKGTTLIYIAGCERSGSSLLDVLLGNHSAISGVGEVHRASLNPETRRCTCGVPLAECPYWQGIRHRYAALLALPIEAVWARAPVTIPRNRSRTMRPLLLDALLLMGWPPLLRASAYLSPDVAAHLQMARHSWTLYEAITAHDGTTHVVDSTKNAVRLKLLHTLRPTRTKVIHLVRDGRGVAASLMRWYDIDVVEATRRWRTANRNVALMLATIPRHQRLFLRYEDLCDEPEATLTALCAFIGVPFEPGMARILARERHPIPGSPSLFAANRAIVKDERWRTSLSVQELEIFERLGGQLNRRYGYPPLAVVAAPGDGPMASPVIARSEQSSRNSSR